MFVQVVFFNFISPLGENQKILLTVKFRIGLTPAKLLTPFIAMSLDVNFPLFLNPRSKSVVSIWIFRVDLQITLKITVEVDFKIFIWCLAWFPTTFVRKVFHENSILRSYPGVAIFIRHLAYTHAHTHPDNFCKCPLCSFLDHFEYFDSEISIFFQIKVPRNKNTRKE